MRGPCAPACVLSPLCAAHTADSLELVPEVLAAAEGFFGLQPGLHGGRATVGDALREVPALAGSHAGRYDYILHDVFRWAGSPAPVVFLPPVLKPLWSALCSPTARLAPGVLAFCLALGLQLACSNCSCPTAGHGPPARRFAPTCSGGGTAPPLMDVPFFRQLSRLLSPAGVLAVNYYGGKGPSLKETWCRLRLAFDHGEKLCLLLDGCYLWGLVGRWQAAGRQGQGSGREPGSLPLPASRTWLPSRAVPFSTVRHDQLCRSKPTACMSCVVYLLHAPTCNQPAWFHCSACIRRRGKVAGAQPRALCRAL